MHTIEVQVERDYLERLATSKSPVSALAELIWNALDADAHLVVVTLQRNDLGGITSIGIEDDGHGLSVAEADEAFKKLGGSWKLQRNRTQGGRILHGKQGKGRFQAFALGAQVEWISRYQDNGQIVAYRLTGRRDSLKRFTVDEPTASQLRATGTSVTITSIDRLLTILDSTRARQALTEDFALYLRRYPDVRILYDGDELDPARVEDHVADYDLSITLSEGQQVPAGLTIIEWTIQTDRALHLCDGDGFALHILPPGIHAPGFVFTAYLKSDLVRDLWKSGDLQLEELHPDLKRLVDSAKDQLRDHFRERAAEKAGGLVEQWKEERVYPFEGPARSVLEEAERQVFDVLALSVHDYLPDFRSSSAENRKLSFRLLRTAIETSPESVQIILRDVLNLPREKQEELAELLEKTSLEAIINASKIVADRLDFLQGLEVLVFNPEGKKATLERRHLHKIVAEHTWLFGEEFNLTVSDQSLTSVLRRHLDLTRVELLDGSPVVREDDSQGRVDLMFSRTVPQPKADQVEHLIVELKRPRQPIGTIEATQIQEYATAIALDDRFRDTKTRWEFWAVSNEVSDSVRLQTTQADRPHGLYLDAEEVRMRIWVRTWGQVIEDCRARLRFFQEKLDYVADDAAGLEYLRRVHAKYLPRHLASPEIEGNTS